jgi:hypothetical protein
LCCIFLGLYGGEGSALGDGGGAENKKTVYEITQSKYFLHSRSNWIIILPI